MESDSTAACSSLVSTCRRFTHSGGWLGDGGAAPSGDADDEKEEPSPVFLNLMKPDPTSDYGTWQRRRVLGHTAELLLVTVATFFNIFYSPALLHQPIEPLALTFIRVWKCTLTSTRKVEQSLSNCAVVAALKIQH